MNEKNDVMETKNFTVPFEYKREDVADDSGMFVGYGSIFGNIDLGGDIVQAGAFSESLAGWKSRGEMPAMYGFHENNNPIGDWLEMDEDVRGLKVKGQLWVKGDKRIDPAVVAHNIMRGTGPKGLSIGYRTLEFEDVQTERGMVRNLIKLDLLEVSVVGFAMNPQARVEGVKSFSKRGIEKVLRDSGLSKRQAMAFIADGFKAIESDSQSGKDVEDCDNSQSLTGVLESLQKLSNRIS